MLCVLFRTMSGNLFAWMLYQCLRKPTILGTYNLYGVRGPTNAVYKTPYE